ncbi:MAG: helix-turn-helix domain-containing protein [Planctomycetota bacterium]
MPRLQILAVPNVFDSAFFLIRDTLLTAARVADHHRASVEVVTLDGRGVRSAGGQLIRPDRAAARTRARTIVVPGFSVGDREDDVLGYIASRTGKRIARWLAGRHEKGTLLAAGCTGVWLLAEAGVLDGCEATTTWYLASAFRRRYPRVNLSESKMLTRDRGVVCAGAAMAHMDLALAVVGSVFNAETSRRVAALLLLDSRPSQSHFMITDFMADQSDDLRRADTWIRENVGGPIRIADVAEALHMSARTLARRVREASGLSPIQYIQRIRAEEAALLLKTTDLPTSTIAARVGYGDTATLRRLMKRLLNQTPSALRT